jgi:hypothetical protein
MSYETHHTREVAPTPRIDSTHSVIAYGRDDIGAKVDLDLKPAPEAEPEVDDPPTADALSSGARRVLAATARYRAWPSGNTV